MTNAILEDGIPPILNPGLLTDIDIRELMKIDEIVIHPFEDHNLTPVGYNLTPSDFILSINSQLLVNVYSEENEKFCFIEPNDTVVIMTREAIKVGSNIAGTFHSRVSIVSKGFGHISTTLDPKWQGPLLISLNNPTKRRLKLMLAQVLGSDGKKLEKNLQINNNEQKRENEGNPTYTYSAFVTLMLTKTATQAVKYHKNPSGRFDLLKRIMEEPNDTINPFSKKQKHFNELKEMIENIGNLDFIKNVESSDHVELTKERFEDNYAQFTEMLRFYTDRARKVSNKIKKYKLSWKWAFKIFQGIFYLIFIGVVLYFIWKFSDNGNNDGIVSFSNIVIVLGAWAFTKIISLGWESK